MTSKILIAEDHEIYRDGLRSLIQSAAGDDAQIIESGDYSSTLTSLADHSDISLLSLDIHMPGTQGLEALANIKKYYPLLPIVVVSTVDHQASIQQMLQLGADAFVAKTCSKNTMIQAFKDILKGQPVVISNDAQGSPTISLSLRQIDVLERLALGMSNKEIATELAISPVTVRDHVSEILQLFDCTNRTQAVTKAYQLGFIFAQ